MSRSAPHRWSRRSRRRWRITVPAAPTGRAGTAKAGLLQRDPDSEEVEAPLVRPLVPRGSLLVSKVVDGATVPLPSGWRYLSTPARPRRLTGAPRRGSFAPWGPLEVTTLVTPMPRLSARPARSARRRSARSARSAPRPLLARSARSARSVVTRPTGAVLRLAGSMGTLSGVMRAWGVRCRCRIGACDAHSHTHCRRANGAGQGEPPDQLLQFHGSAPLLARTPDMRPRRVLTLGKLCIGQLSVSSANLTSRQPDFAQKPPYAGIFEVGEHGAAQRIDSSIVT
jgi:hypothetical protein